MDSIDQNLAMQQRRLIMNKHGEILVGLLDEAGSNDIVVICHGFLCTKENEVTGNLAYALQRGGFSTFRFDFSGNGESEGVFQYANYHKEVEDLRAVIEHFLIKENRKTAAIVGFSKGGNIVLLYASKFHDIDLVVNISGRFTMGQGIQKRLGLNFMERVKQDGFLYLTNNGNIYRVTLESLKERKSIKMGERCRSIKCRVVTIHGEKDTVVYPKDVRKFGKVIANHKLDTIPGANHGFIGHEAELAAAVMSYIKEYVQE